MQPAAMWVIKWSAGVELQVNLRNPFEFFTVTQSWQCLHYCQLCVPTYLQFSSLIASTDVSTCEISNQGVCEDYILRLNATLFWLIFNGRAKTKLATLAFLCCGETVKNSIAYMWKSMQARDPPWFETHGRRYQKSQTGVSVVRQKGPVSLKI